MERSGLYELPLGTPLRELIEEHGGGSVDGRPIKMVFPGGLAAPPLSHRALDVPLDFDALDDAGSALGNGEVLVVANGIGAPEVAVELARVHHERSCGKCPPCSDGTRRILAMFQGLADHPTNRVPAPTRGRVALRVLNERDDGSVQAGHVGRSPDRIDQITEACEFMRHRGDCHHSAEVAASLLRLLELFRPEFERPDAHCGTSP